VLRFSIDDQAYAIRCSVVWSQGGGVGIELEENDLALKAYCQHMPFIMEQEKSEPDETPPAPAPTAQGRKVTTLLNAEASQALEGLMDRHNVSESELINRAILALK
ncbi:MAG: hypothetical protein HQL53_12950, partial [Magnetococcales bacterium]|nr:hypothetical protein [Magnetococcales bacterium]